MNTQVLSTAIRAGSTTAIPKTPRGRALHTIDWFLNGKPVMRNCDNPNLGFDHFRA